MPKVSHRLSRVAELIQREVALLVQTEIEDPRIKEVTFSSAKVSPDLHYATLYFTTLDETNSKKIEKGLNHAAPYLRRRIAEIMQMRIVPNLRFIYDKSLRKAEELTRLIDQVAPRDNDEKAD